jgi:hypothetical protein
MSGKMYLVAAAVALFSQAAGAATAYRTGSIEVVQFDNASRPNFNNVVWIKMTGSWSGVSCGADWAWFSATNNAPLVAAALSAKAMQLTNVRVYVDDSLPWSYGGNACTVSTILLE